ncbi:MAG: 50S ribosomal protein L17 [Verrucomicrobia bacterium]|jgi:large subunit ribosomal protein L17|nr:50S ribosomal protein L17 [Verrucomicrobiota bacterium]
MRHLKRTAKLGRQFEHRNAMLANMVCSLIKHKRITTTLAKAKAARPVAEKMVTLGKAGTIHARRQVAARLRTRGTTEQLTKEQKRKWREQEDVVRILFDEIAPAFKERNGGYTRIVRMEQRNGDAAQRAILEWVDFTAPAPAPAEAAPTEEAKPAEDKSGSK